MNILGLGGLHNEPACAVLVEGALASAVEQKKVVRRIQRGALPEEAIAAALRLARIGPADVDCVALVRPFAQELHLALRSHFSKAQVIMVEHHAAHAASAFYPSPFDEATVLTLDRDGDFRSAAKWHAGRDQLRLERDLYYPDSLGDLYGRVTELLGFEAQADEHKVQWLSTQAESDAYVPLFEQILGNGDWPAIDRSFFDSDRLVEGGFSEKFYTHLGLEDGAEIPPAMKAPIAAGLQRAIERRVLRMAGVADKLCIAGGLGLNTLLIGALEQHKQVFVQPAAGNAGTAIGAVFYAWNTVFRQDDRPSLNDLCLGPSFDAEEIKQVLENCKLRFRYLLTMDELIECAVRDINGEKIIAWMQGRMEFGSRALGNRSILASPLNAYSTENLNAFIKHREPFRKFAASVPAEIADEYFIAGPNARYLATVSRVLPKHRETFEAAVMGKDLIRVHTVQEEDNPLYHRLLHAAGRATGLPVLYNTSFNLFGDPLVCSPRDAVRSFYSSGIDALFVGNFLVEK
ncbi:MAG TPA: carbamoyltransferase C-terminal domain-containing protein [Bryobacteraceae bacterium]|nr:carbamoyltransferase C-terminal domain-containing protein [Bryobacteraceae bacterium]